MLAILAAIFLAVTFIVAAAIANGSFFLAPAATALMLIAAGATAGGIALCGLAASALDAFSRCAGERCTGAVSNLRNVFIATGIVLGTQATACVAAAGVAWIWLAGQLPMGVIAVALLIQVSLVISAFAFYGQLSTCQLPPTAANSAPRSADEGEAELAAR